MTHVYFKYPESTLLVQAINALGKDALTSLQQSMISEYFQVDGQIPKALASRVLKDTQYVTSWIYQEIKALFTEQDANN